MSCLQVSAGSIKPTWPASASLERCTHCGTFPVLIKCVTGTVYAKEKWRLNALAKKSSELATSCLSRRPLRLSSMSLTSAASSAMGSVQLREAGTLHGKFWLIPLCTFSQCREPTSESETHKRTCRRTLMGKSNVHTAFLSDFQLKSQRSLVFISCWTAVLLTPKPCISSCFHSFH